jgi:hypothetical protein
MQTLEITNPEKAGSVKSQQLFRFRRRKDCYLGRGSEGADIAADCSQRTQKVKNGSAALSA